MKPIQEFVNFSLASDFLHNHTTWALKILLDDVRLSQLLEYILKEKHRGCRRLPDGRESKISGVCVSERQIFQGE